MKILGLNLSHHASCAIVEDGELIFAIEEDRFSKIKEESSILKICNFLKNQDFDAIVYTHFNINNSNKHIFNHTLKNLLIKNNIKSNTLIEFPWHHLSHAYSCFYNSGSKKAICLIIDNGGVSINYDNKELGQEMLSIIKIEEDGSNQDILKICRNDNYETVIDDHCYSIPSPSIPGVFDFLKHFINTKEAGAVMGLSCYGKENKIIPKIFLTDRRYFFVNPLFLYDCLTCNKFSKEDLCFAVQKESIELISMYLRYISKYFPDYQICLSGGYFQNCNANYAFLKKEYNIFVDPVSHDGGTAIGIAQGIYHKLTKQKPNKYSNLFLGTSETDFKDIETEKFKINLIDADYFEIANLLNDNNIVAIFQGKGEFGPRALGNRSFLFNPKDNFIKEKLNLIKKREWYRPYAGTVLYEEKDKWFNFLNKIETPYMSYALDVLKDKKNIIPGITHIDGSCRIQTLKKEENIHFYNLIEQFNKLTNVPIIGNTSLNLANEPLANSYSDVVKILVETNLEYVYLPDIKKLVVKNVRT